MTNTIILADDDQVSLYVQCALRAVEAARGVQGGPGRFGHKVSLRSVADTLGVRSVATVGSWLATAQAVGALPPGVEIARLDLAGAVEGGWESSAITDGVSVWHCLSGV